MREWLIDSPAWRCFLNLRIQVYVKFCRMSTQDAPRVRLRASQQTRSAFARQRRILRLTFLASISKYVAVNFKVKSTHRQNSVRRFPWKNESEFKGELQSQINKSSNVEYSVVWENQLNVLHKNIHVPSNWRNIFMFHTKYDVRCLVVRTSRYDAVSQRLRHKQ